MKRMLAAGVLAILLVPGIGLSAQNRNEQAGGNGKVFLGVALGGNEGDANTQGITIRLVAPDSPAAKAGIRQGDIIEKVGDRDAKDYDALMGILRKHRPGEQVTFHLLRDGQQKTVNVTLGERPSELGEEGGSGLGRGPSFLGVLTTPLNEQLKDKLGVTSEKGAVVTEVMPDTPAAKAGLKQDDLIISFNGRTIANPQQLRAAVHATPAGKEVPITVLRGTEKKDLHVRVEESPVSGLSPFPLPGIPQSNQRDQQLERRVQQLENRVRDLEKNRNAPPK